MRSILLLASHLVHESYACIGAQPSQYAAPAYQQQYYYYGQQGQAPAVAAPARAVAAAADRGPSSAISSGHLSESKSFNSLI